MKYYIFIIFFIQLAAKLQTKIYGFNGSKKVFFLVVVGCNLNLPDYVIIDSTKYNQETISKYIIQSNDSSFTMLSLVDSSHEDGGGAIT
jgi:hypothetical protein